MGAACSKDTAVDTKMPPSPGPSRPAPVPTPAPTRQTSALPMPGPGDWSRWSIDQCLAWAREQAASKIAAGSKGSAIAILQIIDGKGAVMDIVLEGVEGPTPDCAKLRLTKGEPNVALLRGGSDKPSLDVADPKDSTHGGLATDPRSVGQPLPASLDSASRVAAALALMDAAKLEAELARALQELAEAQDGERLAIAAREAEAVVRQAAESDAAARTAELNAALATAAESIAAAVAAEREALLARVDSLTSELEAVRLERINDTNEREVRHSGEMAELRAAHEAATGEAKAHAEQEAELAKEALAKAVAQGEEEASALRAELAAAAAESAAWFARDAETISRQAAALETKSSAYDKAASDIAGLQAELAALQAAMEGKVMDHAVAIAAANATVQAAEDRAVATQKEAEERAASAEAAATARGDAAVISAQHDANRILEERYVAMVSDYNKRFADEEAQWKTKYSESQEELKRVRENLMGVSLALQGEVRRANELEQQASKAQVTKETAPAVSSTSAVRVTPSATAPAASSSSGVFRSFMGFGGSGKAAAAPAEQAQQQAKAAEASPATSEEAQQPSAEHPAPVEGAAPHAVVSAADASDASSPAAAADNDSEAAVTDATTVPAAAVGDGSEEPAAEPEAEAPAEEQPAAADAVAAAPADDALQAAAVNGNDSDS